MEGQVEGLPQPGRRRKLHQQQRVDPLSLAAVGRGTVCPPPWADMVNYVANPPPALLIRQRVPSARRRKRRKLRPGRVKFGEGTITRG